LFSTQRRQDAEARITFKEFGATFVNEPRI